MTTSVRGNDEVPRFMRNVTSVRATVGEDLG